MNQYQLTDIEKRKLSHAKRMVKKEFSHFVKFDEFSGISVCPGRDELFSLFGSKMTKESVNTKFKELYGHLLYEE